MQVTAERRLTMMKNGSGDAAGRRAERPSRSTTGSVLLSDLETTTSITGTSAAEQANETRRNTLLNVIGSSLIDLDLHSDHDAAHSRSTTTTTIAMECAPCSKEKSLSRLTSKKSMMILVSPKNVSFGWNETRLRIADAGEDDVASDTSEKNTYDVDSLPAYLSNKEKAYLLRKRESMKENTCGEKLQAQLSEKELFERSIAHQLESNTLFSNTENSPNPERRSDASATLPAVESQSTEQPGWKSGCAKSAAKEEDQRRSSESSTQQVPYRSGTGTFPAEMYERRRSSFGRGSGKIASRFTRGDINGRLGAASSSSRGLRGSRKLRASILGRGRDGARTADEKPRWMPSQWFHTRRESERKATDEKGKTKEDGRASAMPSMRWSRMTSRKTLSRFHDSSSIGSLFSSENAA